MARSLWDRSTVARRLSDGPGRPAARGLGRSGHRFERDVHGRRDVFSRRNLPSDHLGLVFGIVRPQARFQRVNESWGNGIGERRLVSVCGCSSAFDSDRLVCDGCERGFHFSCTGFPLPSTVKPEDWLCRFCVADGVSSNRWQLGRKEDRAVRLIDMNASPPSDGDGEALVTADAAAAAGSR